MYKEWGHIVSLSHGGSSDHYNIIPICRSCNQYMGQVNLIEHCVAMNRLKYFPLPEAERIGICHLFDDFHAKCRKAAREVTIVNGSLFNDGERDENLISPLQSLFVRSLMCRGILGQVVPVITPEYFHTKVIPGLVDNLREWHSVLKMCNLGQPNKGENTRMLIGMGVDISFIEKLQTL